MNPFSDVVLPLVVAPMFLVSSPELVIKSSKAGVVGALPAANARNIEILDDWMQQIHTSLHEGRQPWMLNMIVHSSYDRFDSELKLVKRYQPSIVSTALGSPTRVIGAVKAYGGQVYADVITPVMAKKALATGIDGLILVCKGAGGHTGQYNPLAFISEVRRFWSGPLGVAGCISIGSDILSMLSAGADFVVSGTRFIAAKESFANDDYRQMLIDSHLEDIIETKVISGVQANWMKASLKQAGLLDSVEGLNNIVSSHASAVVDFSGNIASSSKAWSDVWSAGQGVGAIENIESVVEIIQKLEFEFKESIKKLSNLKQRYIV